MMNLQENIRRILREDKKTKSTNKEFSKYKDSKFNSLRDYTLQDIVNNWESLSDHKNENIKTIRHFIDNPDKITDLVYDGKGLEDGYHRLIAAKILKKPKFTYRLVENLQESIRRVLKEELKTKFFLRRVTPEEVARYFSSFDGQVFFETEIYEEFKYQLVLRSLEEVMWQEYSLGWEDLPEQEEIDYVNQVAEMYDDKIRILYNKTDWFT